MRNTYIKFLKKIQKNDYKHAQRNKQEYEQIVEWRKEANIQYENRMCNIEEKLNWNVRDEKNQ